MHASSALTTPTTHHRKIIFWIMSVLAAVTVGLYARTILFGFIEYDDTYYFSENLHLRIGFTFKGIYWALTTFEFCNWHPLTWLVYLADRAIFGLRPGPLHVIDFSLHAANAALLFYVLWRMTGRCWPAAVVAALFAWHPLRVESVAWISETKDVLAGFFFLLTLFAYFRYAQRPGLLRYTMVCVAFAAALMSKPSVVTLPVLLLLLDYWPFGRGGSAKRWLILACEKIPLLIMTAGASELVLRAQRESGATTLNSIIPFSNRAKNALVNVGQYIFKVFWPKRLAVYYPHPFLIGLSITPWQIALALGIILAITVFAIYCMRSRPYFIVGWLWFLGMLVPMLGIIQAGEQSMADRYSYLPDIGLLIAVVFLAADLLPQKVFITAAIAAAIIFCIATEFQLSYWDDSKALFVHADQVTEQNFEAKAIVAMHLLKAGDTDQALVLAQSAVDICQLTPSPLHVLGMVLQAKGRKKEALEALKMAARLNPYDPRIANDIGGLVLDMGFNANALRWFQRAVDRDPQFVIARQNLAYSLAADGKEDQAIAQWETAIAVDPNFGPAQGWLAIALERKGDRAGAIEHFWAAINNGERRPAWLTELAWLLATHPYSTPDQIQQSLMCAREACDKTHNNDAKALDALAAALARSDRFDDAVASAQQGIDAANAAKQPALAKAIQTRMMLYRAGQPYLAAQ
jgi:protein O-mannosyl-transferase